MDKRTRHAMDYFIAQGWQPHQAAGIVGNLLAESGLDPNVKPGDNGTAFGIAQWRGDRLTNLKTFAASQGKNWRDINVQLAFVQHELNGSERSAGNRIRAATNVQQAHEGMIYYERPFGYNKGIRNTHNYAGRLNYANGALGLYTGGETRDVAASLKRPTSNAAPPDEPLHPITITPEFVGGSPPPVPFAERLEREKREIKPYDDWFDEVGASLQSFTVTGNLLREASRGYVDPFWQIDEETYKRDLAATPKDYWPMLERARSQRDYQNTLKLIGEDQYRVGRLGEGGFSAFGAGLVAGVLDPVTWLVGGGMGKMAQGAHWGYRMTTGAVMGASSNAAMEAASGYLFADPHSSPAMGALFGAGFGALGGVLMRNPATRVEGIEVQKLGVEAGRGEPPSSPPSPPPSQRPVQSVDGRSSSAGAASQLHVGGMDPLVASEADVTRVFAMDDIDQADVARAFGADVGGFNPRFDLAGQLNSAQPASARAIGQTIVSDSVGAKNVDGVKPVTPDSINDRFLSDHQFYSGRYMKEYAPAFEAWAQEMGVSKWQPFDKANAQSSFNALVVDYIRRPETRDGHSPHVARAARAQQEIYGELRELGEKAGVLKAAADDSYVPLMPNINKIAEIDRSVAPEIMIRALSKTIFARLRDLDQRLIRAMAEGYWHNIRRATYGFTSSIDDMMALGTREDFIKAYQDLISPAHAISDEDLFRVYDILKIQSDKRASSVADERGSVRHAKHRTQLDYNMEVDIQARDGSIIRFKVTDLFEQDGDMLLRRYMHTMLGRIAWASTPFKNPKTGKVFLEGVKNETDLQRLKDLYTESYRRSELPIDKWQSELSRNLDNIDFMWKRINGIPLDATRSTYAQILRRIGAVQFIRLMANMGLNQAMEFARIFSLTGWRAAWTQLPALREMVGDLASGKLSSRNQLQNELQALTGFGASHLFHRNNLKMDINRLGEPVGNQWVRTLDVVLDAGQKITSNLTLFRHIHSYQQMATMNLIVQQMADMARQFHKGGGRFDFTKAEGKDLQRLATLGMDEKDLSILFNNLLKHGIYEEGRIIGANLDKWNAATLSKFRVFLNRYTNNLVLNNDFGSMAKWMSRPTVGLILQFRSFVISAWTKAFLHGINHWDAKAFTLLMSELMAGMATYAVARTPMLLNEEGREKYLDEITDPVKLLTKGWARSASASLLPMLADTLLAYTGASFRIDARASGTATGGLLSNPTTGHADTLGRGVGGLIKAGVNLTAPTQSSVRATAQSLLPFSNWIAFQAVLSALISPLPTRLAK